MVAGEMLSGKMECRGCRMVVDIMKTIAVKVLIMCKLRMWISYP